MRTSLPVLLGCLAETLEWKLAFLEWSETLVYEMILLRVDQCPFSGGESQHMTTGVAASMDSSQDLAALNALALRRFCYHHLGVPQVKQTNRGRASRRSQSLHGERRSEAMMTCWILKPRSGGMRSKRPWCMHGAHMKHTPGALMSCRYDLWSY